MNLLTIPRPLRRKVATSGAALLAGFGIGLLCIAVPSGPATAASTRNELTCERIPELIVHYLQKHIRFHYPNDELRERIVDSFVRRIDPAKTLYLRSEAEQIEKRLQGILLDLNDGDCGVIEDLFRDLPKRYAAMEKHAVEFVKRDDYAIDAEARLVIDADKRPRPASVEERNQLWNKLVHFQMANYAVTIAAREERKARRQENSQKDPTSDSKTDSTSDSKTDSTSDSKADPADETPTETTPQEPSQADATQSADTTDSGKAGRPAEEVEELVEITPETLQKAREKLIHRYELSSKRARELTREDMYANFLDSFARALDPHSNYLSKEVLEDFQIGMKLSLEGIGVALSYRDGYSIVDKVIPGGAADSIDVLKPRDKVIAVSQDGAEYVDVIDMDLRDVVRLIRGKRGTTVYLTVLRDDTERLNVVIVRDKINLEEQAASLRIETIEEDGHTFQLGLLDLPSFYGDRNPARRQSARDVRKLLKEASAKKLDGVLLDLSRNGGGLLENAVEIAGLFVEEGGVVAVKDHYGKLQVLRDPDRSIVWGGPLVLLTSRVSASASEIVAGAMKDYGRAVLVGDDHTFGKGTVQSMVELPPGLGALKVTTALFFRPGGVSTQHEGVASDVQIPAAFNVEEFGEKHQPYSLEAEQVAPFVEPQSQGGKEAAWPALTPDLVAELAKRSRARVALDAEFTELRASVAEARERSGVVLVRDILTRPKKTEEDANDDETKDELTLHQKEALRILADYVSLGRQQLAENTL
jgi:carboxyl-terminal processing protease